MPAPTFIRANEWHEHRPEICENEKQTRWLIYRSEDRHCTINGERKLVPGNGFRDAIVRIGRKVFIWEEKFFEIVAHQNGNGGAWQQPRV